MQTLKKIFLITFLSTGAVSYTFAANTLTPGVKITRVDANPGSSEVRIQTDPRHSIAGLGCSSDFWLSLKRDTALFDEIYAQVLIAKANDLPVSVGADDNDSAPQFCNLSRMILE